VLRIVSFGDHCPAGIGEAQHDAHTLPKAQAGFSPSCRSANVVSVSTTSSFPANQSACLWVRITVETSELSLEQALTILSERRNRPASMSIEIWSRILDGPALPAQPPPCSLSTGKMKWHYQFSPNNPFDLIRSPRWCWPRSTSTGLPFCPSSECVHERGVSARMRHGPFAAARDRRRSVPCR
jgi:hypothetical protein